MSNVTFCTKCNHQIATNKFLEHAAKYCPARQVRPRLSSEDKARRDRDIAEAVRNRR